MVALQTHCCLPQDGGFIALVCYMCPFACLCPPAAHPLAFCPPTPSTILPNLAPPLPVPAFVPFSPYYHRALPLCACWDSFCHCLYSLLLQFCTTWEEDNCAGFMPVPCQVPFCPPAPFDGGLSCHRAPSGLVIPHRLGIWLGRAPALLPDNYTQFLPCLPTHHRMCAIGFVLVDGQTICLLLHTACCWTFAVV